MINDYTLLLIEDDPNNNLGISHLLLNAFFVSNQWFINEKQFLIVARIPDYINSTITQVVSLLWIYHWTILKKSKMIIYFIYKEQMKPWQFISYLFFKRKKKYFFFFSSEYFISLWGSNHLSLLGNCIAFLVKVA